MMSGFKPAVMMLSVPKTPFRRKELCWLGFVSTQAMRATVQLLHLLGSDPAHGHQDGTEFKKEIKLDFFPCCGLRELGSQF